jgi:Na+/melibiose symporter-like transporter
MMADFGDEERLAGGADRIALLNAVLTTAQKVGYAIPVGVLFPVLALVGFSAEPGAANAPLALAWVEGFWLALPAVLLTSAALVMARLPLSAARLIEVQSSLARAESR